MSEEFDTQLRAAFPETTDAAVIRSLAGAIVLADDVRRNTPWLANLIGDDHRGLLRRAAAMWQFEADCAAGNLPFQASVVPNSTGSSHLLLIRAGLFEAHIVRTESEGAFPQDAPIRQDKSLSNQGDMFLDEKVVPLHQKLKEITSLYSWLSFDADFTGSLTHVCWCMPEASRKAFLSRINILKRRDGGLGLDDHMPPAPDPGKSIKFRTEVIEKIIDTSRKEKK